MFIQKVHADCLICRVGQFWKLDHNLTLTLLTNLTDGYVEN